MKVKLFSYSDMECLNDAVNEFIAGVNVLDIKLSSSDKYTDILVIYEEKGAD